MADITSIYTPTTATHDDIIHIMRTMGGCMATKEDIVDLQKEVTRLNEENRAQRETIRSLRSDVAVLRGEISGVRAATREEMWTAIEEMKEDVMRWGVGTQREIWEGMQMVEESVGDIEGGFVKLAVGQEEVKEVIGLVYRGFLGCDKRVERAEKKVRDLKREREREAARRATGVSLAEERKAKKPALWFADGS